MGGCLRTIVRDRSCRALTSFETFAKLLAVPLRALLGVPNVGVVATATRVLVVDDEPTVREVVAN